MPGSVFRCVRANGLEDHVNRRDFTRTVTGAAGLAAYPIHGAATIPTGTHRTWALGEPYELAGNRLVFTNWYYVRPGSFGWHDSSGRRLTLGDSVDLGEAHLQRTDYPHGIQLVAQPARRTGPILVPETPWEQGFGFSWTTVLRQEG